MIAGRRRLGLTPVAKGFGVPGSGCNPSFKVRGVFRVLGLRVGFLERGGLSTDMHLDMGPSGSQDPRFCFQRSLRSFMLGFRARVLLCGIS